MLINLKLKNPNVLSQKPTKQKDTTYTLHHLLFKINIIWSTIIRLVSEAPNSKKSMVNLKSWFLLAILYVFLCTASSATVELDAIESVLRRLHSKQAPPIVQESAAKGVLQRLLPAHLHSFEFKIVSKVLNNCLLGFSNYWSLPFIPFLFRNW